MAKLYQPTCGDECYDLSDHQGKLSVDYFKGIKKKGVKCVILRATYTKCAFFGLRVDAHFHHNIKNAIRAGLHIGTYHFSAAISEKEARKEAEYHLKEIKPYRDHIDLPVAFDCEFGAKTPDGPPRFTSKVAKSLGRSGMGKIVDSFLTVVKESGYTPMLYANLSMFNNYLPSGIYKKYRIWVAQHASKCEFKHVYYMWQYTSSNGKLDKNYFGRQQTKPKEDDILPARGYFKKGDKGENVKECKRLLNAANAGAHYKLKITDVYDAKTVRFVKLLEDVRHLERDGEFGPKCLEQCKKTVTLQRKAVNRAVSVSRDNKYVFGVGERAHRYGDPFSETNTGPRMKKKEKTGEPHYVNSKGEKWKAGDGTKYTYENTMCCNPFVSMAYAYGAEIREILKAVQNGSGGGTSPDTWVRYGFENLGKAKSIEFSDLEYGDIIMTKDHVLLYTGGDWMVEAAKEGWGKDTIRHKTGARDRYEKYQKDPTAYVVRYPKKKAA